MSLGFHSIPAWNEIGLLPPFTTGPASAFRSSPYQVSLVNMVRHFGGTVIRRELLTGLLDFRAGLHEVGLADGFQWVDGSFVEDSLQRDGREPRDLDIVTFYRPSKHQDEETLVSRSRSLFDRLANMHRFQTDAHFVGLQSGDSYYLSQRIAYWHRLWSHTREGETKGYLQIDLSNGEDGVARAALQHGHLMLPPNEEFRL